LQRAGKGIGAELFDQFALRGNHQGSAFVQRDERAAASHQRNHEHQHKTEEHRVQHQLAGEIEAAIQGAQDAHDRVARAGQGRWGHVDAP